MKTTGYFENAVLAKRPYLSKAMCAGVISNYIRKEAQPDGRLRFWGEVILPTEDFPRIVRVITLPDGSTILNAFIDSNFRNGGTG